MHGNDFVEGEIETEFAKSEPGIGFGCADDHFEEAGKGLIEVAEKHPNLAADGDAESFEGQGAGGL